MDASIGVQVFAGIVSGIVSLGLLIFVLRQIFESLRLKASRESLEPILADIRTIEEDKVDKDVYNEYCKRIDDNLERGARQFSEIREAQNEFGKTQKDMCVSMARISASLERAG